MIHRSILLLGAVSAAVAICLAVYPTTSLPRSSEQREEQHIEPAIAQHELRTDVSLRDELAALRREYQFLRSQVSLLQQNSSTAAPQQPEPHEPTTHAEQREEAEARRLEYIDGVQAAFVREVSEPGWAAQMKGALQHALQGEFLAAGPVERIECRSRTCRAEFPISADKQPSAAALASLGRQFAEHLPEVIVHRDIDASGEGKMVLYLARDGS